MEIKCYGKCTDMCVYRKEGKCSIHAVNTDDEQEEKMDTISDKKGI